jgi:signal transduction histidine kinase
MKSEAPRAKGAPAREVEACPEDAARIEEGLARATARAVAPLCAVFAPVYVFFAITHPLIHPGALARVMTPTAALTAVALTVVGLRARGMPDRPAGQAPIEALAIAGLVWLNVTLHVAVSRMPHEMNNYGLVAIGLGALFYSVRMYVVGLAVTLASFVAFTVALPKTPLTVHFCFLMLSSTALSFSIFFVRRRAGVRLEALRLTEAAQNASLAAMSARLQAVLDAMREAIFAVDREGRIHGESSRETARVLGGEAVAGVRLSALLYPERAAHGSAVEREAFEAWLAAVFDASPEEWEALEPLAPTRALIASASEPGETRPIALEFRPMVEDSRIARVVVRARDESDKQALERAMRAQEAAFARKLATMQRLVAGGGQTFVAFLASADARNERALRLLAAPAPLATDDLGEALELVHTIKAEADAFEQDELRDAAHALEEALRDAQRGGAGALEAARARADELSAAIRASRDLLVRVSPVGEAVLAQTTVQRADVARLHALLGARDDELGGLSRRLAARPFGELVGLLPPAAAKWAARLGKRVQVTVEGRDRLVPPALADVLGGAIDHLARNAVAHGIELPDARADAGKPAHGAIRIACEPVERRGAAGVEDTVRVVFEDDGAGIPEALRARVFERGFTARDAVDGLSGRGVGLSAAAADLARAGYRLSLQPGPVGVRFLIEPALR